MRKNIILISLLTLFHTLAMAQKKEFTLDDLIPGGTTYWQNTVPENCYLTWWGDKCVKLDVDKCSLVDMKTGKATQVLVTIEDINTILSAEGKKNIKSLLYSVMPQGDKSLILVRRTENELSLINWETKKTEWSVNLERDAENTDYDRHKIAYTVSHNLNVVDQNGERHIISTDGSDDITYGESVHRNEFGIEKGTFWSNNGDKLAFYRMDQSMVSTYPQVNITPQADDTRCARMVADKYPMAGEKSHKVTVGIYDLKTKKTIYLKAGDPTDRYFTNIAWAPDDKSIYMIELNRDQNHGELVEYDVTTGDKKRTLFSEDNKKYYEPTAPITFLPWDNNKFIYQTRKDGYRHIYLYDADGHELRQLTKGKYEVIDFLGFNKKDKTVIYTSNENNALEKTVYKVDMSGRRKAMGSQKGWHNVTISETGRYVADNYSSPQTARAVDLIDTHNGATTNVLTARDKWEEYNVPEIKSGTIKAADGVTDLYYRITLPTNFDPQKKYPAIVYVYGGPHAHVVDASRNYGARGWDIWMAQKGYVMFSIDNRGSENRGLEFEQATFRNLGVEEMKDQMKGVEYLKSLEYVDSTRLGVHGWSFGGFMTTSLMTTYPDVFKCGVAGGPVIDWKYYEVMYGERYMDTPQDNPEGYERTSLLNKAANLKGRLMIIYGGNDPVCVPQHTLSFIRACIDADRYPDLFTYPGDGHNMTGTDRVHLHKVITRYFEEHL